MSSSLACVNTISEVQTASEENVVCDLATPKFYGEIDGEMVEYVYGISQIDVVVDSQYLKNER